MPSITVSEVRGFLPIDYEAQNDTITLLIAGVEDFLGRTLGLRLAVATAYTDDLDGGGFALWPVNRPVTVITSVTNLSTEVVKDADDYVLSGDRIYRVDGIEWSDDYPGCWRVVYTGGEVMPAGLKMAALHLITRVFDNRGGKVTQAAAGYGITWQSLMDSDIWVMLAPYERGARHIG